MTALLLTAQTGKRIRARSIMPEVFPAPPVLTAEERQQELDDIKKDVGIN